MFINKGVLSKIENKKGLLAVQAVFIGIAAFLVIYGIAPLNPQNDAWIMAGYDEGDIIVHYSGWLAYRNSDWKFPLGLADQMGVGTGTMISYTDSIPWAAVFFKLFRKFLPPVFQYFGIYTLLCYILQSLAAFQILFYKTKNKRYSMLGTVLFAFAPILMERAFRHTALGSQWLILFSIYLYLKYKREPDRKIYILFFLLEALAIGIHPYFLPMVFCFSFLCTYEDLRNRKIWSIGVLALQITATYLIGCLIGALGSGIGISRGGFGYYSMNLNALINPTSCGGYNWSSLFKVHPQTLGNYDGFNYLGAGSIALGFTVFIMTISFHKWKEVIQAVKRNIALLFVMCCCTVFAISNVVTFGGMELFTYPLPGFILDICGIFRASSRMFYPVYYLLFIGLLLQLWKYKEQIGRKCVFLLILGIVCIQLLDIRYVVGQKHEQMYSNAAYASILQDEKFIEVAKNSEFLISDNVSDIGFTRRLAVWAHRNGLKTCFTVANSGDYPKCIELRQERIQEMVRTQDMGKNIIATTDVFTALKYLSLPHTELYEYDGIYIIYKGFDGDANTVQNQIYNLGGQTIDRSKNNVVLLNLSDENWDCGVNYDGHTLLFSYTNDLLNMLESAKYVICQEKRLKITSYDFDESYIRIVVYEDAGECKYPQILQLE